MTTRNCYGALFLLLLVPFLWLACGDNTESTEKAEPADPMADIAPVDTAVDTVDRTRFAFDQTPPDSPEEFARKKRLLIETVPNYRDRVEKVLEGVDKIILFEDLGFGEEMELISPPLVTTGWPTGYAVRRKLSENKTALAIRFVLDTLPMNRVYGTAELHLLGLYCGDEFGPGVEVPGIQSANGNIGIKFQRRLPLLTVNCCDQSPLMGYLGFGAFGDTIMAMYIFDRAKANYVVHVVGPMAARGIPKFSYVKTRTNRGFWHPDVDGFPYECSRSDSSTVSLVLGMKERRKLDQVEPMLRIRMF